MRMLEAFLDVVYPPECAACGAAVRARESLCAPCWDTVEPASSGGPGIHAPFAYGGQLQVALLRFKLVPRPDLARALGALLHPSARALGAHADVVLPVPPHPRRLRERGFDHTLELARAADVGRPLRPLWLARTRDTPTQRGRSRRARAENVAGAFAVPERARSRLSGARVLLLDDVVTTGATVAECARTLRAAGARSVITLALALAEAR